MSTSQDLMGLGMPPALAARLGNTPSTIAGVGTTQTGAASINVPVVVATATANNTAFVLSNQLSTGRLVWVWNTSALDINVFPPSGGTINSGATNAAFSVPANSGAVFQLFNGAGVSAETWGAIGLGSGGTGDSIPQQVYNAVSTAPTGNNLNLTGANITGGSDTVFLNLTAALGAGATATLPTVAALVTAMQAVGLNPVPGASYELDIYNTSSGAFSWTTTTNTGWTLNGTAQTIAQNTVRKYIVTLTSLTAAVLQSLGQFAVGAAP
jgi:hypothetical protein